MESRYIIQSDTLLKDALAKLNDTNGKGLVVIDNGVLQGTLTDGDIRRALLREIDLFESVSAAMCCSPLVSYSKSIEASILEEAKANLLKMIPVVDGNGVLIDIYLVEPSQLINEMPVVIMAGGLGTRLGKLTKNCPKPMLEVAGKPLLEININNFMAQGFKNFYISVNYMSEVIEDYFKDGSEFGCSIKYLKEDRRLGTAGPLSLLPNTISSPVIVMNGDVLTKIDFRNLKDFHSNHKSKMTICVRKYDFQVPYGVINMTDGIVSSLEEKPIQSFYVNAGVYVINSELLKMVPKNEYFDIPHLIEILSDKKASVSCFPIIEEWIDIGHVDDLTSARRNYDDKK